MKRILLLGAVLLLVTPLMLTAIVVGLNDDVHFDYRGKANDFHIEGTVQSRGGGLPIVTNIIIFGDPGTGNWHVTQCSLIWLGQDTWKFIMHFKTDGYITFCQWIHFGIKFDVKAKNIIAKLQGWWTLDGKPIPHKQQGQRGQKAQVAVTGFEVFKTKSGKVFRLTNDTNIPIDVTALEFAVSDKEIPLKDMFITGLGRPGKKESPKYPRLKWINAVKFLKTPMVEQGKAFEIPLEKLGISLKKGQFLLIRGKQLKKTKEGQRNDQDWGWFWEQHGE